MKTILLALAMALVLIVTAPAYAQTIHLKVTIPFNFSAGGVMLPAGQYDVQSTGSGENVLAIRSSNSRTNALVITNSCQSVNASRGTRMVFHRYGAKYVLSEVWVDGNRLGRQLSTSSQEAEYAKDFPKDEVVLVAAR